MNGPMRSRPNQCGSRGYECYVREINLGLHPAGKTSKPSTSTIRRWKLRVANGVALSADFVHEKEQNGNYGNHDMLVSRSDLSFHGLLQDQDIAMLAIGLLAYPDFTSLEFARMLCNLGSGTLYQEQHIDRMLALMHADGRKKLTKVHRWSEAIEQFFSAGSCRT
jgi:hypothetical protein